MNTQHTPGPWLLEDERLIVGERYICELSNWYLNANTKQYEKEERALAEERNSNARLIAAAPELLAMLEDVQSWLNSGLNRGNIHCGTANRDGDLVSQIRAVIAKAKGQP